jgi:hypothetical protein
MDVAYVSTMAALVGSVVGGLTSGGTDLPGDFSYYVIFGSRSIACRCRNLIEIFVDAFIKEAAP